MFVVIRTIQNMGRVRVSKGDMAYLSNEQNQEDRIPNLLLWFEPTASFVTLCLETSCVRSSRSIAQGVRVVSLNKRPGGICVLRSGPRVIRGLTLTNILPAHDGGEWKGIQPNFHLRRLRAIATIIDHIC